MGNGLTALTHKHYNGYCKDIEEDGDRNQLGKAGLENAEVLEKVLLSF